MLTLPFAANAALGRTSHVLEASGSSAPLRFTIVLASDAQRTDSCALTAQSLRDHQYNGSISYATELSSVPTTTMQTLRDAKVDVIDLQTLLDAAHPADNSSWVGATPRSCRFSTVDDALRIPDTEKRSKGWHGYYLKTLAAFSSYWRHPAGFDRVLYVDCGARALASPVGDFFTKIDSAGRLLAERDADEFTDPAFTALGLSSQFLSQCNQSAYSELGQRSGGAGAADALLGTDYFNDAMMLYDTSILGEQNAALRDIVALYNGAAGQIAVGDQAIVNYYFGPLGKDVWHQLPRQRGDGASPDCFYDYHNSPNQGCSKYLLVKDAGSYSRAEARARRLRS